jgi:hypothetical protein
MLKTLLLARALPFTNGSRRERSGDESASAAIFRSCSPQDVASVTRRGTSRFSAARSGSAGG